MYEDIAVYVVTGLTLAIYAFFIAFLCFMFLPGGLAKFHSLLGAILSSLFIFSSLFTFLDRVKIEENGVHTAMPFMFNILLFLAQISYYHSMWDYLRLDNFIASTQVWTLVGYNFFLFLVSFAEFPWTRGICCALAVAALIIWAQQSIFFRHRIGHRELILISMFGFFSLAYGVFVLLGPTCFNLFPFWIEVLVFCGIFVFVHIPSLFMTYWWDNLTVGVDALPWFAHVYNYDNVNFKPTTESVRRYFQNIGNVGKRSSSRDKRENEP